MINSRGRGCGCTHVVSCTSCRRGAPGANEDASVAREQVPVPAVVALDVGTTVSVGLIAIISLVGRWWLLFEKLRVYDLLLG
eukprot:2121269-Pyramimonas_sp.AAC.1